MHMSTDIRRNMSADIRQPSVWSEMWLSAGVLDQSHSGGVEKKKGSPYNPFCILEAKLRYQLPVLNQHFLNCFLNCQFPNHMKRTNSTLLGDSFRSPTGV
ncbi:hypothetical protein AVEN_21378-1 [Araneus ventricosus]|uniref:Uncharacterized protein n=1 Tax=Araneus ventricosus TaxID=182803 RepID=A0A4Y2MLA7_ARAVE|nr:hypothetical protein AVEN_21378-1 [Araneus ventricosus]